MKSFLFFAAFCFAADAHGQLLIQTDIVPETGEQFSVYTVRNPAAVSPGADGINAVWNWSDAQFSVDSFKVKKTLAASNSPYAVFFPAATVAVESFNNYDATNKAYDYFELDTGLTYSYLGNRANGVMRLYSNPSKDFHFPFGYNNSYDDGYCFEAQSTGGNVGYCGSMNLHFDGVGTLILPYGTFTGIYRIRHTRADVVDGQAGDTLFTTVYSWYKPGLHHPIATHEEFHSTAGATIVRASILSFGVNGIAEAANIDRSLQVYPNPFHQGVSVLLDETSGCEAFVYAMDGRLMARATVAAKSQCVELDLNHLPVGIYLLTVQTSHGLRCEVIVKE